KSTMLATWSLTPEWSFSSCSNPSNLCIPLRKKLQHANPRSPSMKTSVGTITVVVLRAASAALSCALLLFAAGARSEEQSMPTRHVPTEMANGQAKMLGHLPATQQLKLNIALPLRNEDELDDLLQKLYDPKSGLYHQFLSVEEFTARFGPTEQDYSEVERFAEENGLRVTGTYENRMVLNVTGSAGNIEKAFHVKMNSYKHP